MFEDSNVDLDYFKELLDKKTEDAKSSYLEEMAIRQQMSDTDFDAEDELKCALDEIKRHEKEGQLIVTIATSMFDKINDLGSRATEMEEELNESRQQEEEATTQNSSLQDELQNYLNSMDKFEMIKADLELQINEFQQIQTADKSQIREVQAHNTLLEDLVNSKDQKIQQIEHANKQLTNQLEQDLQTLRNENDESKNIRTNLEKVIIEFKFQEKNLQMVNRDINAEIDQIHSSCEKYKAEYQKIYLQRSELEANIVDQHHIINQLRQLQQNEELVNQIEGNNDSPTTVTSKMQIMPMNKSLNSSPTDSHPHSAQDNRDNSIYNSMVQIENGVSPDQTGKSTFFMPTIGNQSILDQENQYYPQSSFVEPMYNEDGEDINPVDRMQDLQVCEVDDDFEMHDTGTLRIQTEDNEVQTDMSSANQVASGCQTQGVQSSVAIVQTMIIKQIESHSQTMVIQFQSKEVQTSSHLWQKESSCQFNAADFDFHIKLQKSGKQELRIQSNEEEEESIEDLQKRQPQTTRVLKTSKFEFGMDDEEDDANDDFDLFTSTENDMLTKKQRLEYQYLLKRDPLYEFFQLTCQSIKLNSPHINTICHIDPKDLYAIAIAEQPHFFKWGNWIEDYLNREFIKAALGKVKGDKQRQHVLEKLTPISPQKMDNAIEIMQQRENSMKKHKSGFKLFKSKSKQQVDELLKKKEEMIKDLDQSTSEFLEQLKGSKPNRKDSKKGSFKTLFK